ncbi:phosphoglycerol geranylgeranyltransferase [Salegentibacter salegens]|uniref:Geranylgeranylglyceryl phosphate synthase n=1 Tax=Salegentibacter salegens TaxID=143223 RepID=A0A1M7MTU7_9FLAO|nr:geranylgeranylglyceryl/heptaprenylglyceryl phosphate synthase [Salegentibacter salegens]PRX52513.1 putative glycerol-1-phosphate prenyltransferase [Salegentibacter salegens]SHM94542.1 putative glycerol-1-phosphate prenyltransferase [Salegentibacter salegens]
MRNYYAEISQALTNGKKLLAILIDPDKFIEVEAAAYLKKIPKETTHIFVGGSTVEKFKTEKTVKAIKTETNLPVILFPGDYSQITETADALLFLSLLSGRNPEYLIEQQVKSVEKLKHSKLEIIPTAYILIDGGKECAVQRVSGTKPIPQSQVETIVNTALAGEFSGKKLIYLEAGSGAIFPVSEEIIAEVKKAISIPLVVGGGIRSFEQQEKAYKAGADMIVMGTQFEN